MVAKIFTSKHIVPQAYVAVLDQHLESGWLYWEPATVWSEIERIFKVKPIPEVCNKINAIKVFKTTPLFYTDAPAFENVVLAINDLSVDPAVLQVASPEEMVYAIKVLKPIEDRKQEFSHEVIVYIQVACRQIGLLAYPPELKFAQPKYEGALEDLAKEIKPVYVDPAKIDYTNINQVQGSKLFTVQMYSAKKFASMDLKYFEE